MQIHYEFTSNCTELMNSSDLPDEYEATVIINRPFISNLQEMKYTQILHAEGLTRKALIKGMFKDTH